MYLPPSAAVLAAGGSTLSFRNQSFFSQLLAEHYAPKRSPGMSFVSGVGMAVVQFLPSCSHLVLGFL